MRQGGLKLIDLSNIIEAQSRTLQVNLIHQDILDQADTIKVPPHADPLRERIPGLRILHQTGERDYDATVAAYAKLALPVEVSKFEVFKFMDNMPAMFASADLILCRSGASTVAEIAAAGKPSVFVPFPKAADDHQRRNAEAMQTAGAAIMIEERDLAPEKLADTRAGLLFDAVKLKTMSTAARGMAHPNATKDIAELAASFATRKLATGN